MLTDNSTANKFNGMIGNLTHILDMTNRKLSLRKPNSVNTDEPSKYQRRKKQYKSFLDNTRSIYLIKQ